MEWYLKHRKNILITTVLIISFISYGQGRRTVSALGVEEIQYGTIAKYIYDGNPFNDNEKKLGIQFTKNYSFRNRIDIKTVDFTISKSDVSPEKILINKSLFNWRINGSKDSIAAFFEFIFDNDKSTYFKLDATSVKKLKLLDNDLFLKFKDISNNYGSTLFDKKCNSYDLIEFLQENTYLVEKDNISKDNELFIDDNY